MIYCILFSINMQKMFLLISKSQRWVIILIELSWKPWIEQITEPRESQRINMIAFRARRFVLPVKSAHEVICKVFVEFDWEIVERQLAVPESLITFTVVCLALKCLICLASFSED